MKQDAPAPTCDEVTELLPEHVLGTLPASDDDAVRHHLRGCGSCRREMAMLGEGLATFSRAAHQADPPPELKDRVMAAVAEERAEPDRVVDLRPAHRRRRWTWLAVAATVAVLAGTVAWGSTSTVHANNNAEDAAAYHDFLHALGGRDVRVATLQGEGARQVEGSAILYDSDVGQSWVLVLVRSPGAEGTVRVVLHSPKGRIFMHRTEFNSEGSTDAWLVTSTDISKYNRVEVYDGAHHLLASGRVVMS
ncbi:MAG TPA: anti-sigma factor [Actinomycetota bacterium]|nr:anti-sigma factor [Actinomycetota bacterium]